VKRLIAAGFDSGKWICVRPERSAVLESGNYVLLAVGGAESVEALLESFRALAGGTAGEANIFFQEDALEPESGAGGDAFIMR
jgi:hypothetical protein